MTTFYLIRHGQIDANVERLWHGSTDSPLNALGRDQADKMGQYISKKYPEISKVYSSPLKRTLNTAEALSGHFGLAPVAHAGLREYGVGEWEGHDYDAIIEDYQFMTHLEKSHDFAPPGGDSLSEVRHRMLSAFEEIRDNHPEEHIAIVGHGAALAIALSVVLLGKAFPFYDYHMDNTGVSVLHWGPDPELIYFNGTAHLD